MADDNQRETPRCRKCGQVMRETSIWDAPVPLEVILKLIPGSLPLKVLKYVARHFECPEGHAGGILISASGARDSEVRKAKDLMVN